MENEQKRESDEFSVDMNEQKRESDEFLVDMNEQKRESDEVSVDMNKLVQSLRSKTETLETTYTECCIYRVSPRVRELNKKAYSPEVVSIGPFHHGKEELGVMEEYKRRYLVDFVNRCKISLEEYVENVRKLEIRLRNSYAQITQHSREEFLEIMAVDAAFLLEFFLKRSLQVWASCDRIWDRQCLVNDIRYDILMIENQLPFFLLESLFELLKNSNANNGLSLIEIVAECLRNPTGWDWLKTDNIVNGYRGQVNHLIDFLGICLQPPLDRDSGVTRKCESLTAPTISMLHRAGVKFKPNSSKCLYDIKFKNGILEIPKLVLVSMSDIILSNMQVFEQCHDSYHFMNDYTGIMDMLINTAEDVEILVRHGCIENWLQDNEAVATVINGLGKSCLVSTEHFSYAGLIQDLNAYCRTPWYSWKATLKQKYFNNPWTVISVIAAAFLLLLTVIQTVVSILQIV